MSSFTEGNNFLYLNEGTGYPWAGHAITILDCALSSIHQPLTIPVNAGTLLPTGSTQCTRHARGLFKGPNGRLKRACFTGKKVQGTPALDTSSRYQSSPLPRATNPSLLPWRRALYFRLVLPNATTIFVHMNECQWFHRIWFAKHEIKEIAEPDRLDLQCRLLAEWVHYTRLIMSMEKVFSHLYVFNMSILYWANFCIT